ncbi:MAG TPA: M20/M25/M40 family metallo-hydrolase [Vicinamibacterales bacterium]|nr:M20/M25/M40 family metallo-hydrolase [Vicinamibacterales bacterium]
MTARAARLVAAVCFLLVLALPAASQRPRQDRLLRIDRASLERVDPSDLSAMRSVVELRGSWIVNAPAELADRLARRGIAITVIDENPSGRWFEVVREAPSGARRPTFRASPVQLDAGVWLVPVDPAGGWTTPPGSRTVRVPGDGTAPLSRVLRPGIERRSLARGLPTPDDPRIAGLAARVSADRLRANVAALQSFQTRDATTAASRAAANFLHDYFQGLGLRTEHEDFTFEAPVDGVRTPGLPASNVIATIPGTISPGEVVIVGAHYDSWSRESPRIFAPGADDNASGTAAVMEIARVLAGQEFDFTVRLIAFGAEEYGLHGSRFHARDAVSRGERIIAVLNLDMVGYVDRQPEDLDIIVNQASEWLAARYEEASSRYAPLPTARALDPLQRSSDHAPFWDGGYAAMLGIEDRVLVNPNYHRPTDTVETLDVEFAASVARGTLATAAGLAQLSREPAPPTALRVESSVLRSLFSRMKAAALEWTPPPAGAAGYHVYRSATPHIGYQRLTPSPVTGPVFTDRVIERPDLTYYYVVAAVDAAGRESNYSAEAADAAGRGR